MSLWLSPSTASLYFKCKRCLWIKLKEKIAQPRGIFPSLPGGMDLVLKDYSDIYRAKGEMLPELKDELKDYLLYSDAKQLTKWRNWKIGLSYESPMGVKVIGALDDALVDKKTETIFTMFDFKTKGSNKKIDVKSSKLYYGLQLSFYALLFDKNGYKVSGKGFLAYYYPKSVQSGALVQFGTKLIELEATPQLAIDTCMEIVKMMDEDIPESGFDCEYCNHHKDMNMIDAKYDKTEKKPVAGGKF